MDAKTLFRCLATAMLPLLAACQQGSTPADAEERVQTFVASYDHALNAHRFDDLAAMYAPGATLTLKNPYIDDITKSVSSADVPPESKALFDQIRAGTLAIPPRLMIQGIKQAAEGYALERSELTITPGKDASHYVVRSRTKEMLCPSPTCMITLADDEMQIGVVDHSVRIESERQTVTALPTRIAAKAARSQP